MRSMVKAPLGIFSAHLSDGAFSLGASASTKMKFETVDENLDGWYDSVNYRYYAKATGRYAFWVGVSVKDTLSVGERLLVNMLKNGVGVNRLYDGDSGGTIGPMISSAVTVPAVAGDYFEVYVYHNHASARLAQEGADQSYFKGRRLL